MSDALTLIEGQIKEAKAELDALQPAQVDWYKRCIQTANKVIPWLVKIGPDLCGFCEEVYNSPEQVRMLWKQFKGRHPPGELGQKLDDALAREQVLIKEIAGDVVSRVMTDYMLGDGVGRELLSNGPNDYPDLFLGTLDYSALPRHTRKKSRKGEDEGHWAAVKGEQRRPARIPDGIEIKTCRNAFRVDCHYPHMGLHVAMFYTEVDGRATVCDLLAAFLRKGDYRESRINTNATTTKASFGPSRFVSLLPGGCVMGAVKGAAMRKSMHRSQE